VISWWVNSNSWLTPNSIITRSSIKDHESIAYCLPTTLIYSKGDFNEAWNRQNSLQGTPNRYKAISLLHRWMIVSFPNFCRTNFKIILPYKTFRYLCALHGTNEKWVFILLKLILLKVRSVIIYTFSFQTQTFFFGLVENKSRWLFSIHK